MGVAPEEGRLYAGPAHRWRLPDASSPLSFTLTAFSAFVVASEAVLIAYEYLVIGTMRAGTARALGVAGAVLFLAANAKTVALALRRVSDDALTGFVDLVLSVLWKAHFFLAPLALLTLGLFLLLTPVPQPPFFHVAYGVLLWQAASGILAREALPAPGDRAMVGRRARSTHRQPAVFLLLAVLVVAGLVDAAFP